MRLRDLLVMLVLVLLCSLPGWAKPVQSDLACQVASAWLASNPTPMVQARTGEVWKVRKLNPVRPFYNGAGTLLAFVVDLNPQGFIIVPADDSVEPILCFSTRGRFSGEFSSQNPLVNMLAQEIPARVSAATQSPVSSYAT